MDPDRTFFGVGDAIPLYARVKRASILCSWDVSPTLPREPGPGSRSRIAFFGLLFVETGVQPGSQVVDLLLCEFDVHPVTPPLGLRL